MKSSHLCKADYEEVKQRLGMRTAAECYGLRVNRQGFCLCPFHADSHPSMKIYQHDKGYYCFTCHNGGDVIRFTAQLFGLSNEEACKKLIEDFSLPIRLEGLTYREKRERQKAQEKSPLSYSRRRKELSGREKSGFPRLSVKQIIFSLLISPRLPKML